MTMAVRSREKLPAIPANYPLGNDSDANITYRVIIHISGEGRGITTSSVF